MLLLKSFAGFCLIVGALATIGCGGSNSCHISGMTVTPAAATVDHTSAAPGNSQVFGAQFSESGDCRGVGTLVEPQVNWTTSDSSVHLAPLGAQVTASCTAALSNPVTITATTAPGAGQNFSSQATLTCN